MPRRINPLNTVERVSSKQKLKKYPNNTGFDFSVALSKYTETISPLNYLIGASFELFITRIFNSNDHERMINQITDLNNVDLPWLQDNTLNEFIRNYVQEEDIDMEIAHDNGTTATATISHPDLFCIEGIHHYYFQTTFISKFGHYILGGPSAITFQFPNAASTNPSKSFLEYRVLMDHLFAISENYGNTTFSNSIKDKWKRMIIQSISTSISVNNHHLSFDTIYNLNLPEVNPAANNQNDLSIDDLDIDHVSYLYLDRRRRRSRRRSINQENIDQDINQQLINVNVVEAKSLLNQRLIFTDNFQNDQNEDEQQAQQNSINETLNQLRFNCSNDCKYYYTILFISDNIARNIQLHIKRSYFTLLSKVVFLLLKQFQVQIPDDMLYDDGLNILKKYICRIINGQIKSFSMYNQQNQALITNNREIIVRIASYFRHWIIHHMKIHLHTLNEINYAYTIYNTAPDYKKMNKHIHMFYYLNYLILKMINQLEQAELAQQIQFLKDTAPEDPINLQLPKKKKKLLPSYSLFKRYSFIYNKYTLADFISYCYYYLYRSNENIKNQIIQILNNINTKFNSNHSITIKQLPNVSNLYFYYFDLPAKILLFINYQQLKKKIGKFIKY